MSAAPTETAPSDDVRLLSWSVLGGGSHLRMELAAEDGRPRSLVLPFAAASSLMMTLPRMLQSALDQRSGDGALRIIQPLGTWDVEQIEGSRALLLRLSTPDGFEVAFSLGETQAEGLGKGLNMATGLTEIDERRPN